MSHIEKLLQYQEVDSQLLKIDQEVATSEERKKYVQAKNYLTKAQECLDSLEVKASEMKGRIADLEKKYNEVCETLKDYDNVDELMEQGADVAFYKRNAIALSSLVKELKGEISQLIENIKKIDEEYKKLRKDVIPVQSSYAELQKNFSALRDAKKAEGKPILLQLEKIAKDIPEDLLKKYQEKRSERIFPVICAVKMDRCTKCGTELSLRGREALDSGKTVECENCHRVLYKV